MNTEIVNGNRVFLNGIDHGIGHIHVNRFRIHFLIDAGFKMNLFDKFETIFSGDDKNTRRNTVTAKKWIGHQGGEYIQFELNYEISVDHLAGQLRDDWVKVGWKNSTIGFAVDTTGYIVDPFKLRSLLGPIANGPPIREHFLCGRRSWILSKLTDWIKLRAGITEQSALASRVFSARTDRENRFQRRDIFVLETAAIERFSGASILLRDQIGNGLRNEIVTIWSTLLENFVSYNNLTAATIDSDSGYPDFESPIIKSGNVYYQMSDFRNAYECRANSITKQIQLIHPYLESINLHYE